MVSAAATHQPVYRSESDYAAFVAAVVNEHRKMVNAIERRDPKTAEALAAVHTDHTRSRLVDFLSDTLAPATAATPPAARQPR